MYDKAIADCNQAIDLGCRDPLARIYRGLAWREKKEYDKAIADYDEAIRLEPQNAFAFYARASAWGAKKEYAKADADLAEASRLDPRNPAHLQRPRLDLGDLPGCEVPRWPQSRRVGDQGLRADRLERSRHHRHARRRLRRGGRLRLALKWQTRAIELETDAKNKEEYIARLKLYQEKKPYRDTEPLMRLTRATSTAARRHPSPPACRPARRAGPGVRLRRGGRTGPQSTPINAMTAFEAAMKPNEARVLTISVASSWAARAAAMSPDSNARINFR